MLMISQRFDLQGKTALVTGGSKGLGKEMARGLAEAGADIILCSRSEEVLQATLTEILEGTDRRGCAIAADLSCRDETERVARDSLQEMGRVDILINNAGSNQPEPIDEITNNAWDRILELNLSSTMVLSRALAPQMKDRGWGRIIHISSMFGIVSKAGRNAYSASKAALIGFARATALDLGPFGVTVNCIAPGPFLTDLPASLLSEAEKQSLADRTALGRWGNPEELIGPVLLLASDAGSYITGETLVIDGGFTAS